MKLSLVVVTTVAVLWTLTLAPSVYGENEQPNNEEDDFSEADELQFKPEAFASVIEDDDRVQTNFIKVLSALLIRKQPVPQEIRTATRTVMREVLNNRIEKDGYKSYLLTSMLRVINSKPDVQVLSMLDIMQNMSPMESHLAKAVRILTDWLKTPEGKSFLEEINLYIRSLFQRTVNSIRRPKPTVTPGTGLGASGVINPNNQPKPSTLPGDISGLNGVGNIFRADLAKGRIPSDFYRVKRSAVTNAKERVNNYNIAPDFDNNVIEISVSTDERRKPGGGGGPPRRPGGPPRYPGQGGSRPPHDRYPEDNHHQRPPHDRYPEDPHRPRPPHDRYPEDNHHHPHPPNGRPGHYPGEREPPHHHHPPGHYPGGGGGGGRPSHPRPGTDKICIERVPQRKFRTV